MLKKISASTASVRGLWKRRWWRPSTWMITHVNREWLRIPWAASASQRTLLDWQYSSPATRRAGSPALHSPRTAVIAPISQQGEPMKKKSGRQKSTPAPTLPIADVLQFEALARKKLSQMAYDYIRSGGAD